MSPQPKERLVPTAWGHLASRLRVTRPPETQVPRDLRPEPPPSALTGEDRVGGDAGTVSALRGGPQGTVAMGLCVCTGQRPERALGHTFPRGFSTSVWRTPDFPGKGVTVRPTRGPAFLLAAGCAVTAHGREPGAPASRGSSVAPVGDGHCHERRGRPWGFSSRFLEVSTPQASSQVGRGCGAVRGLPVGTPGQGQQAPRRGVAPGSRELRGPGWRV